jgi:predicted lipoprotein with Yx(FWY)xxD motif
MSPQRNLLSLVVAATVFAACSAAGGASTASPAPSTPAHASAATGTATVAAASSSSFGTILTGSKGMTLYTHSGDAAGTSTCTGGCATAWPPLAVPAGQQPTPGTGVTGALTTLTRADGTIQVAYDGLPLYYWQGDTKPGDVTGDGMDGFSVATAGGAGAAPSSSSGGAPAPAPSGSGGRYGY